MGPGVLPGWPAFSSWSLLSPQEALLVALKSLPSGTLLNLASFGADIKPLFPSSRLCSNVSITGKSWVSTNPSLCSSQLLDLRWGLMSRGTAARPALCVDRRRCGVPASTWADCGQTLVAPICWQLWAGHWHSPSTTVTLGSCSSSRVQQWAMPAGSSGWCAGRPAPSGTPRALWQVSMFSNSPTLFPLISPLGSLKSYLCLPHGCPPPIASLSPSAPLFLGCPSPAQSQGTTLAVRDTPAHPC